MTRRRLHGQRSAPFAAGRIEVTGMAAAGETEQHVETQLADLVRSRRAELRLSLRGLAAECVDPLTGKSGLIGYNWVDRLEKQLSVTPPQLPELRALAAGLDLALPLVQAASAAQFMGITSRPGRSPETRAMLAYLEEMSEAERRQVLAIVEAYDRHRITHANGQNGGESRSGT
ncbi:XRE family transcriptional regulator [Streptomyces sp. NPDC001604]|uniref:XRE family transcriptional regulator n=1 Tax=Streptomyces sp. NPDC001604 TaxID=3364593 RepID=UPI0036B12FE0